LSKKKKQGFNQQQGDYYHAQATVPVPVPEVVNMDVTAVISDEELFARMNQLETDRSKVIDHNFDPYLWEVELAYLRREAQIRRQRREAHEVYLSENAAFLAEASFFVELGEENYDKNLVN